MWYLFMLNKYTVWEYMMTHCYWSVSFVKTLWLVRLRLPSAQLLQVCLCLFYYSQMNLETKDHSGALKSTLGYSRVPKNTHKPSWALMSTVQNGANALEVVCHYAYVCSLALMSAIGDMGTCKWVLMVACEWSCMLISTHECGHMSPWVPMATLEHL